MSYLHLHIHSVLIGDSLDCILYFEVSYHCIVIYISLLYIQRSLCTNVMKIYTYNSNNIILILILTKCHLQNVFKYKFCD